jgi:hypothetical protein
MNRDTPADHSIPGLTVTSPWLTSLKPLTGHAAA